MAKQIVDNQRIENIEIDLVVEAMYKRYGYDFRNYARSSLKRRIQHRVKVSGLPYIADMLPKILHDNEFSNQFLKDMSVTVTDMFRDPSFFLNLRKKVMPVLKTYPFIKLWHAGCATGEEVYSMAILLKEEGLYDKAQIYATDYNNHSLEIARKGIYSIDKIKKYTDNYFKAGGSATLNDYYHAKYDSVILDSNLRENIIFSDHNLVTDSVFGEMNLVICRNVLIYFDLDLKERVLDMFLNSLCHRGFLCLGSKEGLVGTKFVDLFETINRKERIFRKQAVA